MVPDAGQGHPAGWGMVPDTGQGRVPDAGQGRVPDTKCGMPDTRGGGMVRLG